MNKVIGNLLKSIKNTKIKSISGLDAAFLYAETPNSPMNMGSVAVIEGALDFDKFRATIASRIHLMPKLRQRLLYVPLSIDYPYWVDDPNFDVDLHVHHMALPKPNGWSELRNTAAQIFSEPLDQSRPLWSFTFVEGLDNIPQVPKGSVAIISKIHHVAIDGVAGAGLLALLFDMSADVTDIPEPKPWNPTRLPNDVAMMIKSTLSFAEKPLKLPKIISEAVKASVKMGYLTRANHMDLPAAPFTAPPTPLNGIISARRKWNTAILSLDRIKVLKTIMDTTFNDIILAICAGALRRYLLEKEQLPNRPLVAMVPISTRVDGDHSEGNQITSMRVQLATNVENPVERLELIHENTLRGKTYHGAIGAKTLTNMAEVVPFGLANQAARIYSRYSMAELHNPLFNLTITNVPGPQFPLYINGHELLSIMGTAPIIDGMGLIITIFSYNGHVTLSSTSDANSMPDLDTFSKYLRDSANQLEEDILTLSKKKKKAPKKNQKAESNKLFTHIRKYLKENAQYIKPNNGVFHFKVTGDVPTDWKIDLNKSPGLVRKSKASNADATFTISDKYLMKIAKGEQDLQTTYVQGRLKIEGDLAKAMKLGTILGRIVAAGGLKV